MAESVEQYGKAVAQNVVCFMDTYRDIFSELSEAQPQWLADDAGLILN